MSSPQFITLPREIHMEISSHIQPSEMHGLVLASKYMRIAYGHRLYHSIKFKGEKMELTDVLEEFINSVETKETTKAILPAIKHLTVEVEPGFDSPDEESQLVLPRLIAQTLGVLTNLQGVKLDLWWLSDEEQDELCNQVAELPVWKSFRSLQMASDADPELLAVLAAKSVAGVFKGLQLVGQPELRAAQQLWPFLRRLAVPFELPAVSAGNLASTPNNTKTNSRIFLEFPQLEWLVLGQTQITPADIESIRSEPKLLVRTFLDDLAKLGNLERLGLRFQVAELLGSQAHNLEIKAMNAFFQEIARYIFQKLPALKQIALIDEEDEEDEGLTVFRAVKQNDGTVFSTETDCDRHAFPMGTLY
ncbi:hypothetical protein IL306_010249 [Fusarium sp. DS 682]|nr:hypothetical protein IL306_010249 [Fusarium sp. DS 682]